MSDIDYPKLSLGMAYMILGNTFTECLVKLAERYDNQPGPWLDEIEHGTIENVKKCETKGLSEEDEFKVMRGAIAIIEAAFHNARHALGKPK